MDVRALMEHLLPGVAILQAVDCIRERGLDAGALSRLALIDDPRIKRLRRLCAEVIGAMSADELAALRATSEVIHPPSADRTSIESLVSAAFYAAVLRPLACLTPGETAPPDATSLALIRWPSLSSRVDRDGLLRVDRPMRIDANLWCLRYKDGYLAFSRLLGRDPVYTGLVPTLWNWHTETGGELRLRVDYAAPLDRPALGSIKLAEMYGPRLTSALLDDEHEVGAIVYHDPEAEAGKLFHEHLAVVATLSIQPDAHEKVCTIEELVPSGAVSQNQPFVPVRYLHAVRDLASGTFRHCDGAIKGYALDQYVRRTAGYSRPAVEKSDIYAKAWRIDGEIDTATWTDLVTRWFSDNYLILELLEYLADESSVAADGDMQRYAELRSRLGPRFRKTGSMQ